MKTYIDKNVSKKADEFAEREYVCGAEERDRISFGFYHGYKEAEKDLGWHSVDESLPPIDEEVIVLVDIFVAGEPSGLINEGFGRIAFGHVVNPDEIVDVAGKPYRPVSHNGWNIPGIRYWMYCPEVPIKK